LKTSSLHGRFFSSFDFYSKNQYRIFLRNTTSVKEMYIPLDERKISVFLCLQFIQINYVCSNFNVVFLCDRAQFSISLKTHSSHGMIFYVSDQKETNFMALFVAHGRLIFMFNAGHQKIRIKSQEKYNDGLWHNVSKRKQSL